MFTAWFIDQNTLYNFSQYLLYEGITGLITNVMILIKRQLERLGFLYIRKYF